MKTNLFLALLSAFLTVFILNAILESIENIKETKSPKSLIESLEIETKASGIPLDRRTKMNVVMDMISKGYKTYPSAYTHTFLEDLTDNQKKNNNLLVPLALISHAKYVLCNELGQWSIFDYDRYGFNNDDNIYTQKKINKIDPIILIGDSMVEGQCVQKGEDIASQMRTKGIYTISLGMGGSGPLRNLATLKEYALPLKPRIVLWFFTEANDFIDLKNETNDIFLKRYLKDNFSQNLINRQDEIDDTWKTFIQKKIDEKLAKESCNSNTNNNIFSMVLHSIKPYLTLYQIRGKFKITGEEIKIRSSIKNFEFILKEAKKLTSNINSKLYIVYLPSRNTLFKKNILSESYVKKVASDMNIPIIDFREVFLKLENPLSVYPIPPTLHHFNAKGYRLIADEIMKKLQ